MPDPSPDHLPKSEQPRLPGATISFVISREKFDAVPKKRALYIGIYVSAFLLWLYVAIGSMILAAENAPESEARTEESVPTESAPAVTTPGEAADWERMLPPYTSEIRVILIACIIVFYLPFVSVLRTMGYPWPAVIVFSAFVVLPIPGLFVVAYLDTRIAKTWNSAALKFEDAQAG